MSNLRIRRLALKRDLINSLEFGRGFPRTFQRLYIPANAIQVRNNSLRYDQSCQVTSGDWDKEVFSIWSDHASNNNFRSAYRKYSENLTWTDVGAIDSIFARWAKNGASRMDVENRLANLDKIYTRTAQERLLPTMAEVGGFREFGGILIHFGRDLNPILGRGGNHRLAIALALDIPCIPVQVGAIHETLVNSPSNLENLKNYFSQNRYISINPSHET